MKHVWVGEGVLKLASLFRKKSMGEVIRDAVLEFIEGGEGIAVDYIPTPKKLVKIDRETLYLINRMKVELGYDTQDEFLFDAVVNYAKRRGLEPLCIKNILEVCAGEVE